MALVYHHSHWLVRRGDDEVMRRLKSIEATLCGKYLVNRYHKLPDEARYSMVVAFEGEAKCCWRHAHILAYVPPPTKKRLSHSMMISLFPWEFRFLWSKYTPAFKRAQIERPWEQSATLGTFEGRLRTHRPKYCKPNSLACIARALSLVVHGFFYESKFETGALPVLRRRYRTAYI